jgi:hypothetical protein
MVQVLHATHHLRYTIAMTKRSELRKITDYETYFRCAGGHGIIREEVWVNRDNEVVRYNLAFLLPHLSRVDNGRVLGFDNAHGVHERHDMGKISIVPFKSYRDTSKRFFTEAEAIRRVYED